MKVRLIVYSVVLLAVGLYLLWQRNSDPKSAFVNKVTEIVAQVNEGKHAAVRKYFSNEAVSMLEGTSGLTVQQVLMMAHQLDAKNKHQYRFVSLTVFYPKNYAEVLIERSGPEGDFTAQAEPKQFPVPFIYQDGSWLVAGGFRGDQDFISPFSP